jgi:hypothetical protein
VTGKGGAVSTQKICFITVLVAVLLQVNSVLDDAEQHAGAYDFYIFTGGTSEMILGGKIADRQNLQDKDGIIIPGEYRGQPVGWAAKLTR